MADLKNIALTLEAERVAKSIEEVFPVTNLMDLARLGFAYAIRQGVDLQRGADYGTKGGSNYSSAGLDAGGRMAEIVAVFFPHEGAATEPYRVVETLMNKGLVLLGEHLEEGTIGSISDLMPQEKMESLDKM
ncbi:hypothetical protein ACGFX4_24695 [Kitasatospora sp. NPDC048365]|uniref:hypothetical protein n=1 Tax=Kitasatospora sp. NPDC048365 TaxID=3364050 RepID=UPI00371F1AD2